MSPLMVTLEKGPRWIQTRTGDGVSFDMSVGERGAGANDNASDNGFDISPGLPTTKVQHRPAGAVKLSRNVVEEQSPLVNRGPDNGETTILFKSTLDSLAPLCTQSIGPPVVHHNLHYIFPRCSYSVDQIYVDFREVDVLVSGPDNRQI